MSLKQDLIANGVNLSDMARDSHFAGENYPNLYEVLRKEERGMPIRPGSAQDLRLGKLRSYLAGVLDGSVGTVRAEEQEPEYDDQGMPVEVGDPDWIRRAQTQPVPRGLVLVRDPVRIKGKLCGPGTVITLSAQHGPLEAGTYRFMSAYARPEDPTLPVEINLYGGPGYLRAKKDPKTGLPKWVAKLRTVRPDCFSRARPAPPRPTPDSDFVPEDYGDDDDD